MSERLFLPVAVGAACQNTHWVCECMMKYAAGLKAEVLMCRALLGEAAVRLAQNDPSYANRQTQNKITAYLLVAKEKEQGQNDREQR